MGGSADFDGEDELKPDNSHVKKYKLPRMLLNGCGAINPVLVPRKLRSAIKKGGRECVTRPLTIPKQCKGKLRKDGAKKSKLKMKHTNISKDEKEVVETLYALADMFSDANKAANLLGLHNEAQETKSSAVIEAGSSVNAVEEDTVIPMQQDEFSTITSQISLYGEGNVTKFQSSDDAREPQIAYRDKPATSGALVNQSENLSPRPETSTLNKAPSDRQPIIPEQVMATGIQHSKHYYPMDDKNNGLTMSPSLYETERSCPRLPKEWLENTKAASSVLEKSIMAEKPAQGTAELNKSLKRCSRHIHISRLIKVLKVSEMTENLVVKHTDLTPVQMNHAQKQATEISVGNNGAPFTDIANATADDDIHAHKRAIHDQQLASETSASWSSRNKCYDFLSLGTGVVCGMDSGEPIDQVKHSPEAPKELQSQNLEAIHFSLGHNSYSSTFDGQNSALAAQQVKHPQYLRNTNNSTFMVQIGQQAEPEQRKWCTHPSFTRFNSGEIGLQHILDRRNGGDSSSVVNYVHDIFPNLHAALKSKYQLLPPQHQQLMTINSSPLPTSNGKIQHRPQRPLGPERGVALYYDNIRQLHQLPCKEHL